MELKTELKILLAIVVVFLGIYFLPLESVVFATAIDATLDLSRWYARERHRTGGLDANSCACAILVHESVTSQTAQFGLIEMRHVRGPFS